MHPSKRRLRFISIAAATCILGTLLGVTTLSSPAGAAPATVIYDCAVPLQAGQTAPMAVTFNGTVPATARPDAASVTATNTTATVTFAPEFVNNLIAGLIANGFPAPASYNVTVNSIGQQASGPVTPLNKVSTNITTANQAPDPVNGNSFVAVLPDFVVNPVGATDGSAIQWLPGLPSDAAFTMNLAGVPVPIGINSCILANGVTGPTAPGQPQNPPSGAVSPAPAPWGTTSLVNAAPVPQSQNVQVLKNSPKAIQLVATDDVSVASYAIATGPAHGSVVVDNAATGAVTYTPALDYEGPDSFTFTATDNQGKVSTTVGTISLTVIGGDSENEVINQEIIGDRLFLDQMGDGVVTMPDVTLTGYTQQTNAAIDALRVRDARGDETVGWDLDAKLLGDFINQRTGYDPVTLPGGRIPMDQLSMDGVACTVFDGQPVAQVSSNTGGGNFGGGAAVSMCSSPAARSGGAFDVVGALHLTVPPYLYTGNYQATLQFTVQ